MPVGLGCTPRGRVLVAEDDDEMRSVLADALRREGFDVHAVVNGVELLLELARDGAFRHDLVDVIVADVRMPLCSGLDILETIHVHCPNLPVVLLTAFGGEEMHARVASLGAVLIDKPVAMDTLAHAVAARVMIRRRGRAR